MKKLIILPALALLVLTGCTQTDTTVPAVKTFEKAPEMKKNNHKEQEPVSQENDTMEGIIETMTEVAAPDATHDDVINEVDTLIDDLDNI